MFDDNNSREIEAALREEEELDMPDGMTPDEWRRMREEAQAEEEFIADREDTVKPLVFGKKSGDADENDNEPGAHLDDAPDGVMLGSGDLEVDRIGEPISNEEELRKESVNEDNNPITSDAPEVAESATSDPLNSTESVEAAPAATEPEVVAAPSADVPAVTDTPTPIPGGMPTTPVSTDAPVVAAAGDKPKKKKTGLIIGLAILLVLVIGGVVGGLCFMNWHESPEKQVNDAVSNVLSAKTLGATKTAAIEAGKIPYIKMSMTGQMLPGKDITLSGEIAIKGEDTLYMKFDGLKDLAGGLMSALGGSSSGSSSEATQKLINAIIKPIDSQWIAMTVDDAESKQAMSCLSTSLEKISADSFRKLVKDAFDKYPFIKYKKDSKVEERNGVKYYEVEIDKDLAKKFSDEIEATEEYKALNSCMNSTGMGGMIKGTTKTNAKLSKVVDEDGSEDIKDNGTTVVKLGISSWDHELQAIEAINTAADGSKSVLNLTFKVIPESDVASAKSVEDISKDIETSLKDFMTEYAETASVEYCDQVEENYGKDLFYQMFKSKDDCVNQVKEEFNKQMGDMDVSDIFGGLTGGAVQTRARI